MPTFNAVTSDANNSGTASVAHTAAGSNRLALAFLYTDQNGDPSAATYGGNAMTLVRKSILGSSSNTTLHVYRYIAPDTSSQTCSITLPGASLWALAVCSFTDVDQTTPLGTSVFAETNGAASITVDASSATDELVADFFLGGCASITVGASQTERLNSDFSGNLGFRKFGVSTETGAATTTMSWTITSASGRAGIIAVPIKPVAGGSSSTISNTSPQTIALTVNGRAATANAFTTVTIREVMVNEAGSPVSNRTGMHLLVWYGGSPTGAPDLSYSALTTDANGTASWSLAPGGLAFNQTIFYVATDGGASLSQYTCARMTPTYS